MLQICIEHEVGLIAVILILAIAVVALVWIAPPEVNFFACCY